jgi:hypothetical protein
MILGGHLQSICGVVLALERDEGRYFSEASEGGHYEAPPLSLPVVTAVMVVALWQLLLVDLGWEDGSL